MQSHIDEKSGTPTIGAVIFLLPFFLSATYLYFYLHDKNLAFVIFAFAIGAALGFADDALKIFKGHYGGVSSINKLLIQFLTSSTIVYFLNSDSTIFEYLWAFIVIAGASNAINLTDGLDGLATGVSIISFMSVGIFLMSFGDDNSYTLCLGIVGALLAFLAFNKNPAQIFMGDTGSLALGMGLGTLAYVNNIEWYLLIFAIVPVLEALSVMAQVLSAKLSRKLFKRDWRPFKMAPLHHHFELLGLPETKVVRLFWTVQFVVAIGYLIYRLKLG